MPTIKDVAKLAGVSISTVSYALNGTRSISEETKKKVYAAVKELDYKPSGIARSLKMKRNHMIAVVVNEFIGPIYQEIIHGVSKAAKKYGYEVIAAECFSEKTEITKVLSERFVDGAVILASYLSDNMIKDLAGDNFPIVVLDREIKNKNITSILINNESGAYEAINYFYEKGHRKIGFLGGPNNSYDNNTRYKGFKNAMDKFNLDFPKQWCLTSNFTEEGGYQVVREFLENIPLEELPSAFFVSNDEMAIGAMRAFKEYGISIPEQMAIIGFDDIELCKYVTPNLSTVHRPCFGLGTMAANSLISKLEGEKVSNLISLSSELVIRESC
ncbi:LacI family DNA-binding transcriptional regulator [Vallitalea guaymasensis]|uniref:LacI family DNA-binding transcriptional regulator n=1 Tax=Vallitalea guaymasensis TaxID=1185412 RepID=UPI000DE467EE|nr:LacI family DNA-binding transcriptional regulator [Vallitalea guaymasensis]